MSVQYGWIGNLENKNLSSRGSGTKTAEFFKKCAISLGAVSYSDKIRSKNLLMKDDKIFYLLSIGIGKPGWAPYPFIGEIKRGFFILTIDDEDGKGKVWSFGYETEVINEKCKLISMETGKFVELKLNDRKEGGNYYSLSLSNVKILTGKDNGNYQYDFKAAEGSNEHPCTILKNIFDKSGEERNE
jgi:hypothetical protein